MSALEAVAYEALWTAKQVAEHCGLSKSWVYEACERGEMPHLKISKVLRFEPAAVRAWYQSKRAGYTPQTAEATSSTGPATAEVVQFKRRD